MQSDPPPAAPPNPSSPKPFSPGAGCVIPIVILLIGTFLVGFAIYSFFQQNAAIEAFAAPAPLPIEPGPPVPGLHHRLQSFPLRLTVDDLNSLLATTPELEPIRTMIKAEEIADGQVTATISFPLNKPFTEEPRFLNGTLTFVPRVANGEFFLEPTAITVPGKSVDDGFLAGFRHNRYLDNLLLGPFEEDPDTWTKIESINSVTIEDGAIILDRP
ncbi:hypothetical protein BH23VER1_BH23VER1_20760 [soil metagenome]